MSQPFGGATGGVSGERSIVGLTKRGTGLISPADLKSAFGMGIMAVEIPGDLLIGDARWWTLNALKSGAAVVKKQLRLTTKSWKEHKVNFGHKTNFGKGDTAEVIIYPTGDDESVRIWHYLNGGTSERWAVMSNDWSSKTRPQSLMSGSGSGEAVVTGKGSMMALGYENPKPGIYERAWTHMQSVWGPGQNAMAGKIDEAFQKFATNKATKAKGSGGAARKDQPAEWTKSFLMSATEKQLSQSTEMYDAYLDAGGEPIW